MPALRLPRFSSFRAFEHPGYLPVWSGSLVSNIGTWMETVAIGVYVTQVTGKAEWTGGVAALSYLPGLVTGPGHEERAREPRVLVAEDDPEMRWLVCRALSRAGYRVSEVEDGRALVNSLIRCARTHRSCCQI